MFYDLLNLSTHKYLMKTNNYWHYVIIGILWTHNHYRNMSNNSVYAYDRCLSRQS